MIPLVRANLEEAQREACRENRIDLQRAIRLYLKETRTETFSGVREDLKPFLPGEEIPVCPIDGKPYILENGPSPSFRCPEDAHSRDR